ncbi:MAG: PhzF family phenazine biosynthesis isomerase [Desulfosporosinus sp.]|nr:PhzF family phenazine biosynthesis isomerase [Desulfosporosinus sp.]
MKIFQVDAFANEAFQGNPATVCILDNVKPDSWMQSLADEMNLSETAFLFRDNKVFDLRWFTPKTEVSLCGHATLASAHILWEEKILKENEDAIFSTKSGLLKANKRADSWIELDFPARFIVQTENRKFLDEAFDINPSYVGQFSTPNGNLYLLEVQDEEIVKELNPKFEILEKSDAKEII